MAHGPFGVPHRAFTQQAPAARISCLQGLTSHHRPWPKGQRPLHRALVTLRRTRRVRALRTVALVNVEFNPALMLGLGVMSSGVVLYQLRQTKTAISRDTDLFISCICLCSGGILVFQGWRLDPLLLLCQLFTTTIALNYALEALQARRTTPANQADQRSRPLDPRSRAANASEDYQAYNYTGRSFELPPPASQDGYAEWTGTGQPYERERSWESAQARREPQPAWQGDRQREDSYYSPAEPGTSYQPQYDDEPRWRDNARPEEVAHSGARAPAPSWASGSDREQSGQSGRGHTTGSGDDWRDKRWRGGTWSSQAGDADDWDLYN